MGQKTIHNENNAVLEQIQMWKRQAEALEKDGKTKEQSVNADREAEFLADKNRQASILAAEKRELVRQEKIADQLEAEYKKNEGILRVKEEAYQKELGSLVELFGHLQSSAGEAAVQFSGSLSSA